MSPVSKKTGRTSAEAKFKKLKREVQRDLRKAYGQYVEEIVTPENNENSEIFNSMKRFWKFIKYKRTDHSGISPLKDRGKLVTDSRQKAEILNAQFQSVFTRETTNIPTLQQRGKKTELMPRVNITKPGVLKLLQKLNPGKASGPDGISPRILKELCEELADPLTRIFQKSLQERTVPDDWRHANVAPIFKKGQRYDKANYRPISLTCICSKIMEHIVCSNLMKHAEHHNLFYKLQNGFRPGKSCETQLLEFIHEVTTNMQNGLQTDVCVLDFSKAFDKVGHKRLIRKLQFYGIEPETLGWIEDFLHQRTQSVVVEGCTSSKLDVISGIGNKSLHLGKAASRGSRKIRYHLQSDLTPLAPWSVARPISSFHNLPDHRKSHGIGPYTPPAPTLVLVNFSPFGTVPKSLWIRCFHGDIPQHGGKAESKVEQSVKALKEKEKQKSTAPEPPFITSPGKELAVPRRSLWVRFLEEVKHYYHGFRLLFLDFKVAARLFFKMWKGISLTRREYRQFTRTVADLGRIVPFSLFLIIPMAEILLPFYVKLFPGLMPSTFEDKKTKDERLRQQLRTRLDTARFLLKTMEELPVETRRRSSGRKSVEDFIQFMDGLRQSGEPAPTEEILKYSKLFEDEMTLDNMEHPSLVALCKLLQLQPIGTNNFLRFQLRMRLRTIKADDKMIQRDGINTLTANELQVACRARGMRALGLSEDRLRFQLSQWLDLHLNEEVPTSLLLLSRVLYLPDNLPAADQLQATLSVLPESIVMSCFLHLVRQQQEKTARLKIAEAEGAVDNKTKLDVIRAEEEAIQKELEERKAEEMERFEQEKKKAEAEAQKAQEAAEKEQLVDTAPPVQTEEQIAAETIVDKAPEVKTEKKEEKVLDTDLEEISAALKQLAAEKDTTLTVERDEFNDLKEEYEEFRQLSLSKTSGAA
ncbi:LETM1 [Branchiostoma lanceolatum]|uniref:LETM1 protein n=1 Tax=Branchiostoma lanceolatum TaxID=7740 RepID=A0A8J9ZS56_BRALA|nr:LETM1 [Branchiostoma lanceolatum]